MSAQIADHLEDTDVMANANMGRIIFVTGASRSGTTLLSRILGNHSSVLALRELHFFGELKDVDACNEPLEEAECVEMAAMILARQERDFYTDGPTQEERGLAANLIAAFPEGKLDGANVYAQIVAYLAARDGCTAVCEQTPRNIYYARRLLELYPQARVIHMVRDPRAVLASQKNRWQLRKLGGKNVPIREVIRLWFNYHPLTMSKLWLSATEMAVGLEHHPRVSLLRFEDVTADPEAAVRDVCDWLELNYEDGMLDVPQWGSSNIKAGAADRGVSKAMVAKWKEVLNEGEVAISEYVTKGYLARFGYVPEAPSGLSFSTVIMLLVRYPIHVIGAVLINPKRVLIQLRAILRP